jgi:hypothetical protein
VIAVIGSRTIGFSFLESGEPGVWVGDDGFEVEHRGLSAGRVEPGAKQFGDSPEPLDVVGAVPAGVRLLVILGRPEAEVVLVFPAVGGAWAPTVGCLG